MKPTVIPPKQKDSSLQAPLSEAFGHQEKKKVTIRIRAIESTRHDANIEGLGSPTITIGSPSSFTLIHHHITRLRGDCWAKPPGLITHHDPSEHTTLTSQSPRARREKEEE